VLLAVLLGLPTIQAARCAIADDSGCMDAESCCFPPPRSPWYVYEEGLLLTRRVQENAPMAYAGPIDAVGAGVALDRDNLDDRFTGGAKVLVGHTFDDTPYQLEASYFYQGEWEQTASVTDMPSILTSTPGNLFTPFTNFGSPPDPRVDYDDYVRIHEISRLQGGEFNLKCAVPAPPWAATTVLIGLRYVGVSEEFDYYSQPTTSPIDATVLAPRTPNLVTAHTNNQMCGPQIGVLVEFSGWQNIWLSFEAKGAICDNGASRDLDATIAGTTYAHDHLWQAGAAYLGDLNVSARWRPFEFMTANIGYQLLWLDGLVVASENFNQNLPALVDQTPKAPLDRDGKVLYHGPYAGLEFHW
jgi:hypothetical protein